MKNYKSLLMTLALALAGTLLACNSCTKNNTIIPPGNECTDSGCPLEGGHDAEQDVASDSLLDSKEPITVETPTWTLSLPSVWDLKETDGSPEESAVSLIAYQPSTKTMMLTMDESYNGSLEAYVIEAIQGIKSGGGKILSVSVMELNGKKFFLLRAKRSDVAVWAWITVQDSFGHVFTCGGKEENAEEHLTQCQTVMGTLKFK